MYTPKSRGTRSNLERPQSDRRRSFSSSNSRPSHSQFRGTQTNRRSHQAPSRGRRGGGGRKMPTFNPSQFINKNPIEIQQEVYTAKHTFATLGLNHHLLKNIHSMRMITPTPIQDQIIPDILKGRDVIGLAETGTGKTAAFLIPLIENTYKNQNRQTLILAPTRELALQIDAELRRLSYGMRLFSVICVGGVNIRPQIQALRRKNSFIIGTPGRVLDLIKNKHFRPRTITTIVLDEADRMLDMGFINDIRSILLATPETRETLFFSATFDDDTKKIVNDFLRDPITVSVKKKDITDSIQQDVVPYEQHTKFETLITLLKNSDFSRVLIFGSMKHSVEKLARQLTAHGIESESIHGNKNHSQRQRALLRFKNGDVRVLVATDVAARGIHVESVTHVINYDLPHTFEDYVHRIGRTGRAEKHGKALTFVPRATSSRY